MNTKIACIVELLTNRDPLGLPAQAVIIYRMIPKPTVIRGDLMKVQQDREGRRYCIRKTSSTPLVRRHVIAERKHKAERTDLTAISTPSRSAAGRCARSSRRSRR